MKDIIPSLAREKLLRRFRAHLHSSQGLAARTCENRVFYVREFLQKHCKTNRQKFKLHELTPEVLLDYVLERSAQDSAARLQALASALRSFGRFLRFSGRTRHELSSALPRIASPGRSCLADYLTPGAIERFARVDCCQHCLGATQLRRNALLGSPGA